MILFFFEKRKLKTSDDAEAKAERFEKSAKRNGPQPFEIPRSREIEKFVALYFQRVARAETKRIVSRAKCFVSASKGRFFASPRNPRRRRGIVAPDERRMIPEVPPRGIFPRALTVFERDMASPARTRWLAARGPARAEKAFRHF
jgi:hypothetical protein